MTARETFEAQERLQDARYALYRLVEEIEAERRAAKVPVLTLTHEVPAVRAAQAAVDAQAALVKDAQAALGGVVYRIPEENRHGFEAKMEKLAKRATKLGVKAPTATLAETEAIKVEPKDPALRPYTIIRHFFVLDAEPVKLPGWEFLAKLELTAGGVMIGRVPAFATDETDLERYRDEDTATLCDHCGLARRRNATYVVRETATGDLKRVGRQCLADFIGVDAANMARYAEILHEIEEALGDDDEGFGGYGNPRYIGTEEYLTHVAAIVREHGWTPRSAHTGFATADAARENFLNYGKREKGRMIYIPVTDEDAERAAAALAWVRGPLAEKTNRTEFETNMVIAARPEMETEKTRGTLAYVIVAHAREIEREIKLARELERKADAVNEHFGTVGERIELTLTVEKVFENDGHYGATYITELTDADGRTFKWFGSYELDRGATVTGKWTVKKHGEYKGTLETVLTRPAIQTVETKEEVAA